MLQRKAGSMAGKYSSPPEMTIDLAKSHGATLHTNHGDIEIAFDVSRSPITVNNWLFLASEGFFDGVIFHRVVPGFVIQGGDPTGTGTGGPGYRFRDELEGEGVYARGTVAMANAGPNTNGSQFFICLADVGLPHAYTIFGNVTGGLEAVDAIAAVKRRGERPVEDCVIERVTVTKS
jgi:cyclophilin family peptidyl-prolyl cis-trans isomerase